MATQTSEPSSNPNEEVYKNQFEFFSRLTQTPESKQQNLYKYIKTAAQNENIDNIFKDFYKFFYSRAYEYDISGYNLIFFRPPEFSAFNGQWTENSAVKFKDFFKDIVVLAVDYTPHEIAVSKTQIDLTSSLMFSYPVDSEHGGEISVSYIDSDDLRIHSYHSLWIKYIHYVNMGHLIPATSYIESNTIDYLGTIYSLKFKSNMQTPVLATKAMGVFPTSLPVKESMGVRGQHEIALTSISYTTLYHTDEPIGPPETSELEDTPSDVIVEEDKNPIYYEITQLFKPDS